MQKMCIKYSTKHIKYDQIKILILNLKVNGKGQSYKTKKYNNKHEDLGKFYVKNCSWMFFG